MYISIDITSMDVTYMFLSFSNKSGRKTGRFYWGNAKVEGWIPASLAQQRCRHTGDTSYTSHTGSHIAGGGRGSRQKANAWNVSTPIFLWITVPFGKLTFEDVFPIGKRWISIAKG